MKQHFLLVAGRCKQNFLRNKTFLQPPAIYLRVYHHENFLYHHLALHWIIHNMLNVFIDFVVFFVHKFNIP